MSQGLVQRQVFPATLANTEEACLQLRAWLQETLPSRQDRFALELLAREALANAVKHGCSQDAGKCVRFIVHLWPRRALMRVQDDGPGFDWRAKVAQPIDDEATHGRGLPLFQQYAHRCLYGEAGNDVLFVRNLLEAPMSDVPSSPQPGVSTIRPGDLTASSVEAVRGQLKAALQDGASSLVMDLQGVQMVDSTGIGLLIQAHNSLTRSGGTLTVANASEDIKALFRSMRLDKRFILQD